MSGTGHDTEPVTVTGTLFTAAWPRTAEIGVAVHVDLESADGFAPVARHMSSRHCPSAQSTPVQTLSWCRVDGVSGSLPDPPTPTRHTNGSVPMPTSEYEFIAYEQQGPVVTVTFDRPERMNAIGVRMAGELVDAWTRFRDDDTALVGVVTGRGREAFCAGGDLKDAFAGESLVPTTQAEQAAHAAGQRPGIIGPTRWSDLYKPTIAAVNGAAYAGGLEWVCWADMAIADEHATFGVTCRRWNIGLGDGGTQRLPRIVGYRRAMELIITGRVMDAAEAHAIGLVNEVVPSGQALARAQELARTIAELPQPAIRTDKEAAMRGWGRPLEDGLRIEAACFNRLIGQPEMAEGLRRFNERDHPDRHPDGASLTPGLARERDDNTTDAP